jgi:hypothetical protein
MELNSDITDESDCSILRGNVIPSKQAENNLSFVLSKGKEYKGFDILFPLELIEVQSFPLQSETSPFDRRMLTAPVFILTTDVPIP